MEGTSEQERLFRWNAVYWEGPSLEWLQCPEDQVLRIRHLLQAQFERVWGLPLAPDAIVVEFISQGAWNRAFKVTLPPSAPSLPHPYCRHLVFRLSLPVLQSAKTRSEVATMRWVRQHTNIPVPRVFMYDATGRTFDDYEWILMEHMPGRPYWDVQDQLSTDAKVALARTIAEWVHSLWAMPFDKIGSFQLYFGDWRPEYSFPRGPFQDLRRFCSSFVEAAHHELLDPRQRKRAQIANLRFGLEYGDYEYILHHPKSPSTKRNITHRIKREEKAAQKERQEKVARYKAELIQILESLSRTTPLQLDGSDAMKVNEWCHDNDSRGTLDIVTETRGLVSLHSTRYVKAEYHYIKAIEHSTQLVEQVVPDRPLPPRCSVLHHWDIHGGNVLVDPDNGRPTALLDWEQICTVPILPLIAAAQTEGKPGPADCLPYPKLLEFEEQMCPMSSYYICPRKPSLSWMSVPDDDLSYHQRTWGIQLMRVAYRDRLEELSLPGDTNMQKEIGKTAESLSALAVSEGKEQVKPGVAEASSSRFLSDRDQLVEEIIYAIQEWNGLDTAVERLVGKARGLGYSLDESDSDSESEVESESESDESTGTDACPLSSSHVT
ncbi:hypothetical protein PG993_005599 [Apiospora rasikravindrae]|uniref:Aminoglycoside phosphotransferase domain-containing protein n=1 Tax=Apiospora rasikravindrae TaxID=990691 RepID=A0ABR1THZ7_9PEZI